MFKRFVPRRGTEPVDDGVRAELLALNLRRISRLATILGPVHLAHVVLFWFYIPAAGPQAESWRWGIILAHGLMLPFVTTQIVVIRAVSRSSVPSRLRSVIPAVSALIYLLFGATLAVIDQQVTSSITPFLLTTIGVAATIVIPPLISGILFTLLLVAFWALVAVTQGDPEILLSIRVNSISTTGIGFGIAYLLWQSQVVMLRQRREIEEQTVALQERNDELARLARHDPLTGLANRAHLRSITAAELERMRRSGSPTSLIMLDIDHFKLVNDNHGHPIGDTVLRQIAKVLAASLRRIDTIARVGGEEFAILLPDTTLSAAAEAAERLRSAIEGYTFGVEGISVHLTASLGVGPLLTDGADPVREAYQVADEMLYRAKELGRNRVCVVEGIEAVPDGSDIALH